MSPRPQTSSPLATKHIAAALTFILPAHDKFSMGVSAKQYTCIIYLIHTGHDPQLQVLTHAQTDGLRSKGLAMV